MAGGARGELMVPFVDDYVVEVDLAQGYVVVIPLEFAP